MRTPGKKGSRGRQSLAQAGTLYVRFFRSGNCRSPSATMPIDHSLRQFRAGHWGAVACAASIGLAIGLCSAESYAQRDVTVQVPAGCGSREAFIEQYVALDQSTTALDNRRLLVTIERSVPDAVYVLRITDGETTRELRDSGCATLFHAAVVIAAATPRTVAAGLEGALSQPPSEANVVPTEQQVAEVARPAPEASAARAAPAPARPAKVVSIVQLEDEKLEHERESSGVVGFDVQLGTGVILGVTPKLSFAAEAGAGLMLNRFALTLLGRYAPASTTTARAATKLRADVWGARLGAGYDLTSGLRITLGIVGYRIQAKAVDIRYPVADSVWFLAPEIEAAVEVVEWQSWRGEIAVQGRVAVNTPRFEIEPNDAVIYAVPRWGSSAFFRIKWGQ